MKHLIVGTAGHIDHGKTALVKALTGIDADRLEEEKRRGITIDLGFAHMESQATGGEIVRFGFIDVPGHEKFVRNMLAGVGGIDMVLLVVAADEGVKPQTREHFDICRMLGVEYGITVLTKSDAVDAETLEVARLEVEEVVRGSFLDASRAPMVAVSALSGAGLDELRAKMVEVALRMAGRRESAAARLPIDRVFTIKGFGTVVTGTLISGQVKKEDELELLPIERRLRVRGVEVHGSHLEQAQAGQRTALNLAGVSPDELARGMSLVTPGTLRPTKRVDVRLELLGSARPLKDCARVHLHTYSQETIAEVVLIETSDVGRQTSEKTTVHGEQATGTACVARPGTAVYAQLRTVEPVSVAPGDRFIVRQFSPVITIGGGVVLDNAPLFKRVPAARRIEFLKAVESGADDARLMARVARRGTTGLRVRDAVYEMGRLDSELAPQIAALLKRGAVVRFGEILVSSAAVDEARVKITKALDAFHAANRLMEGIGKEELREKVELGSEVFAGVIDALARDKKIEIAGEMVRLTGRGVAMKSDESDSKRQIEEAFASAGLKVPALKDVLASVKVDRVRAQQIVTLLLRDKTLVKLADDLVFHRDALEGLRAQVKGMKAASPKIDVSRFKDATGVSRKYAIPLLEWLDRERVTRRVGDEREIL